MKKLSILFSLFFVLISYAFAQQGQGRRGGNRVDPTAMANKEKQLVLDSIPSLTEDQVQLLEFVYAQYAESLTTAREEVRASGDREGMREKMQSIRKEKNEGLKDIFSEDQMTTYKALMETARQNMQQRREQRKNKRNKTDGN